MIIGIVYILKRMLLKVACLLRHKVVTIPGHGRDGSVPYVLRTHAHAVHDVPLKMLIHRSLQSLMGSCRFAGRHVVHGHVRNGILAINLDEIDALFLKLTVPNIPEPEALALFRRWNQPPIPSFVQELPVPRRQVASLGNAAPVAGNGMPYSDPVHAIIFFELTRNRQKTFRELIPVRLQRLEPHLRHIEPAIINHEPPDRRLQELQLLGLLQYSARMNLMVEGIPGAKPIYSINGGYAFLYDAPGSTHEGYLMKPSLQPRKAPFPTIAKTPAL